MPTTTLTRKAPLTKVMQVELLTDHFPALAPVIGNRRVYLLRADLSGPSGSFKDFGVEAAVRKLAEDGVTEASTASAGSHALAMVEPCANYDLKLHVLLPVIASKEKQRKIREKWEALGRNTEDLTVTLVGNDLEETLQYVDKHIDPATFIHAYDNVGVIEGRREIRASALRAVPDLTDMVVPVGGGSLFTALTMDGNTWGVEAEGSDSLSKTLRSDAEKPLRATAPNDKFGGCTVRYTGENVVKILRNYPEATDRLLVATNEEVKAVAELYRAHMPAQTLEPTSLVPFGPMKRILEQTSDDAVIGFVATGHNESYENLLA